MLVEICLCMFLLVLASFDAKFMQIEANMSVCWACSQMLVDTKRLLVCDSLSLKTFVQQSPSRIKKTLPIIENAKIEDCWMDLNYPWDCS